MKQKQVAVLSIFILLCLSCASAKKPVEKANSLLPMKTDWYLCDFERTSKGIEDEYNQSSTSGLKIIQEITWKYTGVVCRFEDGVLYDPVTGIELSINSEGLINCAENISIKGTLEKNGRFFWSGVKEEHRRLISVLVNGTLRPLTAEDRSGGEFDGVYHLIDTRTKREQLVNIRNGFYTWKYIDGKEAGFTPWPLLVRPDGSISSSMEIITVIEMGNLSKTNYSTDFTMKGKIVPEQGFSLEEVSRSSGALREQGNSRNVYAGRIVHSGEYPNNVIPVDIESFVKSGRASVRAGPKPNQAKYPAWYLKLPVKTGFIYATGEKTSAVRKTALAVAEAAAAASIAKQAQVRGVSQQVNYKIVEQHYNDETRTAFVLAEMALE